MKAAGGPHQPIVVDPEDSRFFHLPHGVTLVDSDAAAAGADPEGVTYPSGFLAAGVMTGFKESGRPDTAVLAVAPEWRAVATSAAVFTTNAFAAAPIEVNRAEADLAHLLALAMTSGNANACTGETGRAGARAMQAACARTLGVEASQIGIASTGIIGVPLDPSSLADRVEMAAAAVAPGQGLAFLRGIMTTDRFPKTCSVDVQMSTGVVRVGACAKGAGMIAPAMATMIAVVTTDAQLTPVEASGLLGAGVSCSFNLASVDGEMSTNDCVFLLASGASGIHPAGSDLELLTAGVQAVLLRLALMMVADGEGATKIVRFDVRGADTEETSASVARAVADSPLVKTAMNGCDPNWGRVVSASGAALRGRHVPNASLFLCGIPVMTGSAAAPLSEADDVALHEAMCAAEIEILLDLGLGDASSHIYFSDLGHEYITINAEYHT
jgi:glutamate N-acetyltransferase / amino-acid N-acetyltransferase